MILKFFMYISVAIVNQQDQVVHAVHQQLLMAYKSLLLTHC